MIQSVVEDQTFNIANRYVAENRIRIGEAGDLRISAVVIGNSGVYEQTIHLEDGSLKIRCTCSLNEQPFCRHSVAVLLEYHRCVKPKDVHRPPTRTVSEQPVASPTQTTPVLDMKLSEVTVFVEWFQAAVQALEGAQALPAGPASMKSSEVVEWINVIRRLEDRRRVGEEKQAALEADLHDRDEQLSCLNQQLQTAMQEAGEAREMAERLQRELAGHGALLTTVAKLAQDIDGFDSQVKNLSGELIQRASQLDCLGSSFKEISATLKHLAQHYSR